MTKVLISRTDDRSIGIKGLIDNLVTRSDYHGKKVIVKANYNSDDDFPASTHPDTLSAIMEYLKNDAKAGTILLAERSGMGVTEEVLVNRGVFRLAEKIGFSVIDLDDLGRQGWVKIEPKGSHWKRGFLFAKPFLEADKIVQTCCLKVHGFGGHITMSLKNSVGMVAKYDLEDNYPYMSELHSSRHQRLMIAEINLAYKPDLVIMDGIKAFTTEGPHHGRTVEPGLLIGGTDRVAIDALGVAILRMYGTTHEVSKGKIFENEQIARAAELGIGVGSPEQIQLIPTDKASKEAAEEIEEKLLGA
nr:DUF362 domain-containing protein [Candidatus Njordarchaeota archaeon]